MKCTLRQWQGTKKDSYDFIIQASSTDGTDAWQPFLIGMSWEFGCIIDKYDDWQIGNHEYDALCAIRTHTDQRRRPVPPNRKSLIKTVEKNGIRNVKVTPEAYFKSLAKFKFVVSPEGNGIDCHRHYEGLMVGTIPIVEDHPGIREKYAGLPVLYTRDYSEITSAYLNEKYAEMIDQEYDFSKMFLSGYPPELQAEIKRCGNHWIAIAYPNMPKWYS